ncbi:MAG TPA: adenylate/guanylate cyclase domain-containing protein [Stellaceae bacterium]|nr:adenylate/guanylate cyclase domain-containing protein [Stellaceae bacterium]
MSRGWLLRARQIVLSAAAPVLVTLVCAALADVAVDQLAFLKFVDRFVGDWETAALLPQEPQDPDVIIVTITDETLQNFPYTAPIDRGFLADLVTTIAARHPRAIGLDVLLAQPTEPAKDERLRRVLADLPVPLVASYADEDGIVTPAQREFLDRFLPPATRGLSALGTDQFDTVRWIYPGHEGRDGQFVPSFDRALAAAAGVASAPELTRIVWHGSPARTTPPFRQYPANLVATLPAQWFAGKVVLIGTLQDRHRTPFSTLLDRGRGIQPAVVIHAHGVAQLLHRAEPYGLAPLPNFAVALAAAALGAALGLVGWPLWTRLSGGAALVLLMWVGGGAAFHYLGVMAGLIAPTIGFALAMWGTEALSGRKARRQREFITNAMSCYVSANVVDALIRDPSRLSLEGERRVMTYLFTDIAAFTTMSEALDSHDLARVLNGYFDVMTDVVMEADGTIGKFQGDALFVIFNAPMDQHDHAERAVRCALAIDRVAEAWSVEQRAVGVPFGHTRIGVHTGPAVVGNFGSRRRFDYSAHGDAVNTAARLEGVNKQFGTRICVSEATRALCHGILFRPLGTVTVKGRSSGTGVFEPLREETPYLARYREAWTKLASEAPEALSLFAALNQENPDDRCVAMYLERLYRGEMGAELVLAEK